MSATAESPRILLADDDASTRHLLTTLLHRDGYQVTQVASGEETLATIKTRAFDLVLLDVMMHGMDGFAALARIRESFGTTDLPVIMLTSLDGAGDVIQALRLGANDYAVKPVDFAQLSARMQTHLKLKVGHRGRMGKYELSGTLGSGAVGVVYAATDTTTGREVALKVLGRAVTIQRETVTRFLQESALMAKVRHPSVVQLLDTGQDNECYYLAMERIDGRTLEQLSYPTPLPPGTAMKLAIQIAGGLEALHAQGIVHRDIKPQNILVTQSMQAKIADFGIAFDLTEKNRLTQTGVGIGSLLYASPQQLLGQPDIRSDMYALGATLFYMVCAATPFPESLPMPELFAKKFAAPPSPLSQRPELPTPMVKLIMQLMAPAPKDRFATDAALMKALERVNADLS